MGCHVQLLHLEQTSSGTLLGTASNLFFCVETKLIQY